jgi:hypothetical protein
VTVQYTPLAVSPSAAVGSVALAMGPVMDAAGPALPVAALPRLAGLARSGPLPQRPVDGLFAALGRGSLASGELTVLEGQADDVVARAVASQGNASSASRGDPRQALPGGQAAAALEQSQAKLAAFAALAQPPSASASGQQSPEDDDAGASAELWWLRYGQG